MAIYNMGQIGERRESAVGGFTEALKEGLDMGSKLAEAKAIQAKASVDKNTQTRQNLEQAHGNYSSMEPDKRELFDRTPEGKAYLKLLKTYMPEYFDSDGKAIILPAKPKTAMDQMSPEEQIAFKVKSEEAMLKLKAGQPLTIAEATSAVNAIDIMESSGAIDPAVAKAMYQKIQPFLQNKFSGSIAGENTQPPQPVNNADPLGILTR